MTLIATVNKKFPIWSLEIAEEGSLRHIINEVRGVINAAEDVITCGVNVMFKIRARK
jgi:hypothetical protein